MNTFSSKLYVITLVVFFASLSFSQTIVKTIQLPNTGYWNQAYGIAADSSSVYTSSNTSTTSNPDFGYIYTLDYDGNEHGSFNSNGGESQGLASDGANFYYVKRYTSFCAVYKITITGTIIDSMRFPNRYIGGITWDGTSVWISDYYPSNGLLLKINWDTKTVVDSFATIGAQPTGVAWDGTSLYYAMDKFSSEPNLNLIYVINPSTHDTVKTIQMPDNNPNGDINPRGIAIYGHYLWLIGKSLSVPNTEAIYKYDLGGAGSPVISIPQKSFDLGNVQIGAEDSVVVTVENTGTGNLMLDSFHIEHSSKFTSNLTPPYTITPGTTLHYTVYFNPTAYGNDSAYFVLYNNDIVRGTQTVKVFGKGINGGANISVPDSINFGTRRTGSSSKWNLVIENHGPEPLTLDSAKILNIEGVYYFQSGAFPLTIAPVSSSTVRLWFQPNSIGIAGGVVHIYNNSDNAPDATIALSGTGTAFTATMGVPFWNYTVVDNPGGNTFQLVKAVRAINDITEDGKPDIIVSTENYWTMAVNGNGSGDNDSLWAFSTFISNNSAGSIGTSGDYSHQKALEVAKDLNGDGYNDIVIGTGGGNEHVYALDGKNGKMIWTFGTDAPDSFSLGDFTGVDVKHDFSGDGVPDVVAAAAATEQGGVGGRRSAYVFNGTNGELLWRAELNGFTHGIISVKSIDDDTIPDVIGTVGQPTYSCIAFKGVNGVQLWSFPLTSASGGAKEVLEFPVGSAKPDVILGAFWGPVYRLDGATGAQIWTQVTGNTGVMQLARLKDVTDDGIDEVLVATLGNGAMCLNGATGAVVWSKATGNTMGITSVHDLNGDGIDEVAFAAQNLGAYIVRGNTGEQLALYPTTSNVQVREIAVVPDMDGNNSVEIITCGKYGTVELLSGGLDAINSVTNQQYTAPKEFSLSNNYPNPFNPSTTVRLNIPQMSDVEISIYNILGERVKTIHYQNLAIGSHEITWEGTNENGTPVASGVYMMHVKAGSSVKEIFSAMTRLVLLK